MFWAWYVYGLPWPVSGWPWCGKAMCSFGQSPVRLRLGLTINWAGYCLDWPWRDVAILWRSNGLAGSGVACDILSCSALGCPA